MNTVLLNLNDVLNCNKSWQNILYGDISTKENINIFKQKRVREFVDNCYNNRTLSKDMDLATLLILLKHRNCFIRIPQYEATTVKKDVSTIKKVDNNTRGKIIALKSNQNTFNFSITILDEKYLEEKLNKDFEFVPRTYTLTDYNGNLGDNWSSFNFDITDEERKYFKDNIGLDNIFVPTHFVNKELAQCMYTDYYFVSKIFIERLLAERKYITNIKKKYLLKCNFQKSSEFELIRESTVDESDKAKYESIKVCCFEVRPQMEKIEFNFNYINEKQKPEDIVTQCNNLMNGLIDMTGEYKFFCRMVELAFTLMNPYKENLKPQDLQTYNNRYDCKWNEQKVKLPRSRIEWFELMFKNYSLLCRYYDKSIQQKLN